MRVDILCSGSKGNCTLIRSQNTVIMLDCGPTSLRYIKNALAEVGSSMSDLQAMLITHTHGDHIRQLRHFSWLPVYAFCTPWAKDAKKQPVALSLHHVTPMMPFVIGDLQITPFSLSHDAGPTAGFVICDQKEKLVYYTDTGYLRSDLVPFLRGADYYIAESNHDVHMLMQTDRTYETKQRILSDLGHLNNVDSAMILRQLITSNTKQVVLAHLSEEANTPALAVAAFYKVMDHYQVDITSLFVTVAWQKKITSFGSLDTLPEKLITEERIEMENKACPSLHTDVELPEDLASIPPVFDLDLPKISRKSADAKDLDPVELEEAWDVFEDQPRLFEEQEDEEFLLPGF